MGKEGTSEVREVFLGHKGYQKYAKKILAAL